MISFSGGNKSAAAALVLPEEAAKAPWPNLAFQTLLEFSLSPLLDAPWPRELKTCE